MQEFTPSMLDLSAGHAPEDFITDDLPLTEVIIQGVPETELITQAQQGPSQDAYATIFVHHEPRVARVLHWVPKPQAEDVLQDTYIRGWNRLDTFTNHGRGMAPWLSRIAQNRATDLWRHEQRITMRLTDPQDPHSVLQTEPDPTAPIDQAIAHAARHMDPDAAGRVLALIENQVGLDAARLLQIVAIEGRKLGEYAQAAGVAPMTANTRARRIRQKLGESTARGIIMDALEAAGIL